MGANLSMVLCLLKAFAALIATFSVVLHDTSLLNLGSW